MTLLSTFSPTKHVFLTAPFFHWFAHTACRSLHCKATELYPQHTVSVVARPRLGSVILLLTKLMIQRRKGKVARMRVMFSMLLMEAEWLRKPEPATLCACSHRSQLSKICHWHNRSLHSFCVAVRHLCRTVSSSPVAHYSVSNHSHFYKEKQSENNAEGICARMLSVLIFLKYQQRNEIGNLCSRKQNHL